jgi:hypothetical protein
MRANPARLASRRRGSVRCCGPAAAARGSHASAGVCWCWSGCWCVGFSKTCIDLELYLLSIEAPTESVRVSNVHWGSYRNLRKIRFNMGSWLRQVVLVRFKGARHPWSLPLLRRQIPFLFCI